jgi:hypothetical protein
MPADYDEITSEVAEQDAALDLRVLCGIDHLEACVPARGSTGHAPCGLSGRLPDAHVTAAAFSDATADMPEVLLRTRAKAVSTVGTKRVFLRHPPQLVSAMAGVLAHRRSSELINQCASAWCGLLLHVCSHL